MCMLAFASPSLACDCEGEEASLEESLSKSTSVFLGKVMSVKQYEPRVKRKQGEEQYYIIEFLTEEVYKGEKKKKVTLLTEATICGGDFTKGNSYLVFAFTNEQEKKLEYHQCFRMSLPKQNAEEEIAELKRKN